MFVSLFPAFKEQEFRENFLDLIFTVPELFRQQVMIFDTFSELLIRSDLGLDRCYALLTRLRRIASDERTVVLCADPEHIGTKLIALLRSISDVYLRMEVKEQFGNTIKVLHVERFTGAPAEVTQEIPFKVKAGLGIVPELASTS
jgi:flagellar protein FlaH